jgi:hypothetical protein
VPHAWAACAGALVFALHPVQVEPVGWVAGLKDVLCGCLSFAAIWTYLLAVRAAVDSPRERPAQAMLYTLATVLLALAMLAKPTAMVVPAVAFVLHVWGLRRPAREAAMALLPWFVLAVGCAVVAKLAQPAHGVPGAPPWARPLLAGDAIAFYLYKLVFPAWLGIDYGWRPPVIVTRWWFYVLWVIPVALAVWIVRNRKRRPELFAAGAVFALGVAPVLGFTTFLFQYFSTVADHYLYISMLGPAIAVAWFVSQRSTRDTFAIATTVLVILVARSMLQTRVWQNDFTLFTNAVRVNPDSFMAWRNLGYAHRFGGSAEEAERALRRAIELKPDYWEARQDLAQILFADGRADEGIAQVEESIRIKSRLPAVLGIDHTEDLIKFGDTLMSLGRYEEAARQYRLALERRPLDAGVRQKLIEAESKSQPTTAKPTPATAR